MALTRPLPNHLTKSDDRLAAIVRGERVVTETHDEVSAEDSVLDIENFDLWYGEKQALFDITMSIPFGKVTALIGPSGCGKSTLLRSINRLNDLIDIVRIEGDMYLNGDNIYAPGVDVIELRRRMGMVFQKSNPFPMSVEQNVVYALEIDGERNKNVLREVSERSLRGAAPMGRGEGKAGRKCIGFVWWSAAAPLHRSRHRRRTRDAADGRTLQLSGPHRHRENRSVDTAVEGRVHHLDRDTQHAASVSGQRLHRFHVPRPAHRVRSHGGDVHQSSLAGD